MTLIRYRPDIDGLRALAVLGVVIYHAFPNALPGGFIGVDIFFVISGYLISGILYKGHREGNFSYADFYGRRIRRLFPALITMLLLCLAYGWLVLLTDEYEQMGKHVAAGTVFAQNFVFWKESGYFDKLAELKPLLHLWSLAVEEQFYIVFPLLLIALWKKPKILLPAMAILLIASFVGNVVMSLQNSETDFYLTPYRGWEFLGGSLLAWWHFDRGHEEDVPRYRESLSWLGVIMIGMGLIILEKHQPYPGWRALLPLGGTLLLIEGGMGAWVNRKILSHPAVVWIGLISYPLYLFHWPALSFVHIIKGEQATVPMIWAALCIALLLTVITYYGIEKRIRHNKAPWVLPVLITSFLGIGAVGLAACKGVISPYLTPSIAKICLAIKDRDFFEGLKPHYKNITYYSVGGTGKQTLFVGDSNMEQYLPRAVLVLSGNHGVSRGALCVVHAGVAPIPNYQLGGSGSSRGKSLIPLTKEMLHTDPRIDRVVLAALWPEYFNKDKADSFVGGISAADPKALDSAMFYFGDFVRSIVSSGKKVYVVLTIPYGSSINPSWCFCRTFTGVVDFKKYATLSKDDFLFRAGRVNEALRKAALDAGAMVIDPMDYLCNGKECVLNDQDGIPIRYDFGHLRPGYVREKVKYLDLTMQP